jgi:hypothetical protein
MKPRSDRNGATREGHKDEERAIALSMADALDDILKFELAEKKRTQKTS